jgi:hypothetical protein
MMRTDLLRIGAVLIVALLVPLTGCTDPSSDTEDYESSNTFNLIYEISITDPEIGKYVYLPLVKGKDNCSIEMNITVFNSSFSFINTKFGNLISLTCFNNDSMIIIKGSIDVEQIEGPFLRIPYLYPYHDLNDNGRFDDYYTDNNDVGYYIYSSMDSTDPMIHLVFKYIWHENEYEQHEVLQRPLLSGWNEYRAHSSWSIRNDTIEQG